MAFGSMLAKTTSPHRGQKLEEVADKLTPFVRSLCEEEPRFRLYPMLEDIDKNKYFFLTKQHIYIPFRFPTIEHEISHAVEMIDPKRWLLPDWGFANQPYISEKGLTARLAFVAMAREIRVRAIRIHMQSEHLNKEGSSLYNILNNQLAWGEWARRFTPFGRFRNYNDVYAWANDLREKTYNAWSLDRITFEWSRRLTAMQNWMETK